MIEPHKWIASVFLLPDCNLSCSFCASDLGFETATFEQVAELLRDLRGTSIRSVVFGGGEPTLWPHGLERLCRLASDLGLLVQVCTNGVALPRGFERMAAVQRFILPLEAADLETHDRLRVSRKQHLPVVLDRVRSLTGAGREMTFSTVVTAKNLDRLPGIAQLMNSFRRAGARIHAWHLYRFLAVGRGGAGDPAGLAIDESEFLAACEVAKRAPLDFPVYRRDNLFAATSVEFFWFERIDGEVRRMQSAEQPVDPAERRPGAEPAASPGRTPG